MVVIGKTTFIHLVPNSAYRDGLENVVVDNVFADIVGLQVITRLYLIKKNAQLLLCFFVKLGPFKTIVVWSHNKVILRSQWWRE